MTQHKLISREPTDKMLKAIDEMEDYTHVAGFQAMFDAAPHIETEAEKKAKAVILDWGAEHQLVKIIRALLLERGIK